MERSLLAHSTAREQFAILDSMARLEGLPDDPAFKAAEVQARSKKLEGIRKNLALYSALEQLPEKAKQFGWSLALALALTAASSNALENSAPKSELTETEPGKETSFGKLANSSVTPETAKILGIHASQIPESAPLSFESSLRVLLTDKAARIQEALIHDSTFKAPASIDAEDSFKDIYEKLGYESLVKQYIEKRKTSQPETIESVTKLLDEKLALTREIMMKQDEQGRTLWDHVQTLYNLNSEQLAAVQQESSRIDGSLLIEYIKVNLMPGGNPEKQEAVLAFLIENAGFDYLVAIPGRDARPHSSLIFHTLELHSKGKDAAPLAVILDALVSTYSNPPSLQTLVTAQFLQTIDNYATVYTHMDIELSADKPS